MIQTFRSRIDTWVILVLVASAVIVLAVTGFALALSPRISIQTWLIEGLAVLFGLGLPIWIFSTTSYTVDGETLIVRCGPLLQRVELRTITRITPTRSALSAPALSLDRMAITYGAKQVVVISPKEKEAFLRALAQAGVKAATPGAGGPE
jgi:membrane protein YdbS with pleckstrin-like domain